MLLSMICRLFILQILVLLRNRSSSMSPIVEELVVNLASDPTKTLVLRFEAIVRSWFSVEMRVGVR